jgi:hypothetical protein
MYSINARGIRCINNYAEALARYESVTPIRGSNNNRPIGDRRKQHMRLEKRGDEIHAVLYHTSCVIYKPDNTTHINGSYSSVSTAEFITAVAPSGVVAFVKNSRVWVKVVGDYYSSHDLVLDGLTKSVKVSRMIQKCVADREKRKAVRQQFKAIGLKDLVEGF